MASRSLSQRPVYETTSGLLLTKRAEQRGEILCGGRGGKGADQGAHRTIQHEPDTERGTSVPGIERCAASSQGKEAGTVHGSAPPSERGSATGQLLRIEAASGSRGGRREVGGV